jgi:hypothetical protein
MYRDRSVVCEKDNPSTGARNSSGCDRSTDDGVRLALSSARDIVVRSRGHECVANL